MGGPGAGPDPARRDCAGRAVRDGQVFSDAGRGRPPGRGCRPGRGLVRAAGAGDRRGGLPAGKRLGPPPLPAAPRPGFASILTRSCTAGPWLFAEPGDKVPLKLAGSAALRPAYSTSPTPGPDP